MINNVDQAIFTADQILKIINDLTPSIISSINEVYPKHVAPSVIDGANIMSKSFVGILENYKNSLIEHLNGRNYDT